MTADEIDQGILNVWRNFPKVQLLIQVHDSILLQYPEEMEADLLPGILDALTIRWELKRGRAFYVPVEAKVGWNWSDANKKTGENPSGLIEWTGADNRDRPEINYSAENKYSLKNALAAKA